MKLWGVCTTEGFCATGTTAAKSPGRRVDCWKGSAALCLEEF